MTENKSKFIFTENGRTFLVSQTGGIKFAILGYLLIEGLAGNDSDRAAVCGDALETKWAEIETAAKENEMTVMEYLASGKASVTVVMKDLEYVYQNPNYIAPANQETYKTYLSNYKDHLFGTFYIPTNELEANNGTKYGTYAFNFDRTYLNCNIDESESYHARHFILIGKQYAENSEAVFNIDELQNVDVVGLGEIVQPSGKGIQILNDQNNFVTFQAQIRFTVTTTDNDDVTEIVVDEEIKDIANKVALVNNGLKTKNGKIMISEDPESLDNFNVNNTGSIAMTRSLMVADSINAKDAENQFNAASMLHVVNKKPEEGEYVPQILMSSVSKSDNGIDTYTIGMSVNAGGVEHKINGNTVETVPSFKIGSIPENKTITVDIFGKDNLSVNGADDIILFSESNSANGNANNAQNILMHSNENAFNDNTSNNGNVLYESNNNSFEDNSKNNILFGSNLNKLDENSDGNIAIAANNNIISTESSVLIGSSENNVDKGSANVNVLTSNKSTINNVKDSTLFNDVNMTYDTVSAFTSISDKDTSVKNSNDTVAIGNKASNIDDTNKSMLISNTDIKISGSNHDILVANNNSKVTGIYDNIVIGSTNTSINELPANSINQNEYPYDSDFKPHNNLIIDSDNSNYIGITNNTILNSNKLKNSNKETDETKGPERLYDSIIIGSDKAKLYNAKSIALINSDSTRIFGKGNDTGLKGTSVKLRGEKTLAKMNKSLDYKDKSYDNQAETLSVSSRPVDLVKLDTAFINSYGSELNLSTYNAQQTGDTYSKQTIKPQNSTILGGNHNAINGGSNVTFIGAEFSQGSTFNNQVVFGKYNNNVPADLIFGCGNANNQTYSDGSVTYNANDLYKVDTKDKTIDTIRNNANLYNALELYAYHGRMVLRDCNDGVDSGSKSEYFNRTVTIDPRGIIFKDENGNVTGEIDSDSAESNAKWTFFVKYNTTSEKYEIIDTNGTPSNLRNIQVETLFTTFNAADTTEKIIVTSNALVSRNTSLFSQGIPAEINIIFLSIEPINNALQNKPTIVNTILPWVNNDNKVLRYNKNGKIRVNYYVAKVPENTEDYSYAFRLNIFNTINNDENQSSLEIRDIKSTDWQGTSKNQWTIYGIGNLPFAAFNTTTYYSDWLVDNYMPDENTSNYVTKEFLQTGNWTAENATVYSATYAYSATYSFSAQNAAKTTLDVTVADDSLNFKHLNVEDMNKNS